jgi:hypothetical protein
MMAVQVVLVRPATQGMVIETYDRATDYVINEGSKVLTLIDAGHLGFKTFNSDFWLSVEIMEDENDTPDES